MLAADGAGRWALRASMALMTPIAQVGKQRVVEEMLLKL